MNFKMTFEANLNKIEEKIRDFRYSLVGISKTKPIYMLEEAYQAGLRLFGENKVQELVEKQEQLPEDIQWHMVGHLQSNKVKYIAPFVSLIHAVDSLKLLKEINKQALKNERVINCLLQIHIAEEDSKFGLDFDEAEKILIGGELSSLKNIKIKGFMGMATNTSDEEQIRMEFRGLKLFFDDMQIIVEHPQVELSTLSMGMSGDYQIALEEGSNMIRVGSSLFGSRA